MTFLLALVSLASAVPSELSHSGRVLDSAGVPLSGTHSVTWRLFSGATGGTALWTESGNSAFDNGYFNATLGLTTPFPTSVWQESTLYVEVEIDGVVQPRQPVASVPWALRARSAESAETAQVASTLAGPSLQDLACVVNELPLYNGSQWQCAAAASGTVTWDDVTAKPSGFEDGADDVLDEAAVDAFVANNGYITATLTEAEVDAFVANNGYITATLTEAEVDAFVANDGYITATLTEAEVDAFVANNGYAMASSLANLATTADFDDLVNVPGDLLDGDDDTLAALSCSDGEILVMSGGAWTCTADFAIPGDLVLGGVGTTCSAAVEGAIRWNGATAAVEACDGTAWFAVGSAAPPAYYANATAAQAAGLTQHWLFDGNLNSSLGGGALAGFGHGFLGGATTSPFVGITNPNDRPSVATLDGSNDYFTIADRLITGSVWTVSLWVYLDAGNPSGRSYLYDGRGAGGSWYYLVDGTSNVKFLTCSGEWDPANYDIQGRWSHHVLRSDGTDVTITIDGTSNYKVTNNGSGTCNKNDSDPYFGTYHGAAGGSGQYFVNGQYAEVGVWDGTWLNDAEVDALYAAGLPLVSP